MPMRKYELIKEQSNKFFYWNKNYEYIELILTVEKFRIFMAYCVPFNRKIKIKFNLPFSRFFFKQA